MNDSHAGDNGMTSISSGQSLSKDHPLIEAIGSMDEACAILGWIITENQDVSLNKIILVCLRHLSVIMAELSGYFQSPGKVFGHDEIAWLEKEVKKLQKDLMIPKKFIMSFNKPISARLNFARTIIRRAERRVVKLSRMNLLKNSSILGYVNRLSTLIYLLQVKVELG